MTAFKLVTGGNEGFVVLEDVALSMPEPGGAGAGAHGNVAQGNVA